MSNNSIPRDSENEPITGIINTLDALENTLSTLELDVRNELNTQRLLGRCQLNLASRCQDIPSGGHSSLEYASKDTESRSSSVISAYRKYGECNCRCNQALGIYLDQLRQARLEQDELLRKLKMKEEQMQLYRTKMLETKTTVEQQKQTIKALRDNEELVTQKINSALEQENQTLMSEINRLKGLPDELRERERTLKAANKELQETKLTLKSLLLDIESGLEACEDISGELQQERKRAFQTMYEIDEEKRKVMTWVAKYSELKKQHDSAVNNKQSVQQLSGALREKTVKLDQLTKEYEALREESVGFITNAEALNDKQRTELQERVLELECDNLRLKIALEDQSHKTSEASHNMQRELLNLEQKFDEAQDEIKVMKRFNEATAAAAEYGARRTSCLGDDTSLDIKSLTPPFCGICAEVTATPKQSTELFKNGQPSDTDQKGSGHDNASSVSADNSSILPPTIVQAD